MSFRLNNIDFYQFSFYCSNNKQAFNKISAKTLFLYKHLFKMEKPIFEKHNKPLNIFEECFEKLMMLIRIDKMLKSAKVTHKKID